MLHLDPVNRRNTISTCTVSQKYRSKCIASHLAKVCSTLHTPICRRISAWPCCKTARTWAHWRSRKSRNPVGLSFCTPTRKYTLWRHSLHHKHELHRRRTWSHHPSKCRHTDTNTCWLPRPAGIVGPCLCCNLWADFGRDISANRSIWHHLPHYTQANSHRRFYTHPDWCACSPVRHLLCKRLDLRHISTIRWQNRIQASSLDRCTRIPLEDLPSIHV